MKLLGAEDDGLHHRRSAVIAAAIARRDTSLAAHVRPSGGVRVTRTVAPLFADCCCGFR
ncbi:hypothetical protein [Mycobacterium lacus]|uniref:hypothetical protein n=1 Tax=Mycobacterium lacus TaxID=169765 RepID=UPI0013D044C1|nr:hypothetical protein [Mycobacterium lacus]MCV7124299.1 hypothetical protein [Mycobacterium lacus]